LEDNLYIRQAFQAKKWAFVSDYVRLYALAEYGGVYLDTDVELLQPFDCYLNEEAFLGFECAEKVASCVIGAVPHHPLIEGLAGSYAGRTFFRPDGGWDETTNVIGITQRLQDLGLRLDGTEQRVGGITIYPAECFSPKSLETGRIAKTSRTAAIHHFQASWMSPSQRTHTRIAQWIGPLWTKRLKRVLGRDV